MIYCFEFPGGGEPDERIRKGLAHLCDRYEGIDDAKTPDPEH